jgi:hypothetical protein
MLKSFVSKIHNERKFKSLHGFSKIREKNSSVLKIVYYCLVIFFDVLIQ